MVSSQRLPNRMLCCTRSQAFAKSMKAAHSDGSFAFRRCGSERMQEGHLVCRQALTTRSEACLLVVQYALGLHRVFQFQAAKYQQVVVRLRTIAFCSRGTSTIVPNSGGSGVSSSSHMRFAACSLQDLERGGAGHCHRALHQVSGQLVDTWCRSILQAAFEYSHDFLISELVCRHGVQVVALTHAHTPTAGRSMPCTGCCAFCCRIQPAHVKSCATHTLAACYRRLKHTLCVFHWRSLRTASLSTCARPQAPSQ